ncbi:hypothetical protein HF086_007417 [Spodoptera exigua]|uniref:Uncharacterized protein n=1 Tax=Spodoptera exigua TaxID=7107 RepID=A0A922SC99_SPOEX|nr:hypothetical protein HF086_007417 [Spodoptera exigua]
MSYQIGLRQRKSLCQFSSVLCCCFGLWFLTVVCHACWKLASHVHSSNDISRRRVGYQHVCVVCGRSILRISRRSILIEGANVEEQRLANVISTWIQPRQLRSEDEACVPCWLRARRAKIAPPVDDLQTPTPDQVDGELSVLMCAVYGQSLTTTTSDGEWNTDNIAQERQERPQHIVLPNIRRAAEIPQHCVFQECTEPQRNAVPDETRREVLIRFQYYIPRGARICSMHRQEANYEQLYTAEYSLNTFHFSTY